MYIYTFSEIIYKENFSLKNRILSCKCLHIKKSKMQKSVVFSGFFPTWRWRERGPVMRPSTTWTGGLAAYGETALLENTDNTTRPTMVYCIRTACVCASQHTHASPLGYQRISEGAIFEMSSRRVWDLRSVIVASIITATIVPEFIGISIKASTCVSSDRWAFFLSSV